MAFLAADNVEEKAKQLLSILLLVIFVGFVIEKLLCLALLTSNWSGFIQVLLGLHLDIVVTMLGSKWTRILRQFRNRHF